jgi:hypothetical protein
MYQGAGSNGKEKRQSYVEIALSEITSSRRSGKTGGFFERMLITVLCFLFRSKEHSLQNCHRVPTIKVAGLNA